MRENNTRERLLDAAERLFADKGFQETSVRAITTEANAHLAAVNYHFGSKQELIHSVIARRLDPLNRERIRLLEAAQAEAGGTPVPLTSILHAFFAPAVHLFIEQPNFMCLAGRLVSEPDKELNQAFTSRFEEMYLRFIPALRPALPNLTAKELFWRMHFVIGAMIHTHTNSSTLEYLSGGLSTVSDAEEVIGRLISFCAAGLHAPLPLAGEATQ